MIIHPGGKTCIDGGRCGKFGARSYQSGEPGYPRTVSRSSHVVNKPRYDSDNVYNDDNAAVMCVQIPSKSKSMLSQSRIRASLATHVAQLRYSHTPFGRASITIRRYWSAMGRERLSPQGQRLRTIILAVPIMAATSGLQSLIDSPEKCRSRVNSYSGPLQTSRARRTPAQTPSPRRSRRRPENPRISPRRVIRGER